MPRGSVDYEDTDDESDVRDAIRTAIRPRWPTTELDRLVLAPCHVDRYEGKDGDNADADVEEEASQANDGSTQHVENRGHSRFDLGTSHVDGYECEHGDDADADEEE